MTAWLETPEGVRVAVGPAGVRIGRDPGCDLVVDDRDASKLHALIVAGRAGIALHPLGRNPTLVDGRPATGRTRLHPGDTLAVPGLTVVVGAGPGRVAEQWQLVTGQTVHGLWRERTVVGGDPGDDLVLPGVASAALALVRTPDGGLLAEPEAPIRVGDVGIDPGDVVGLEAGDAVALGDRVLRVVREVRALGSETRVAGRAPTITGVRYRFLPSGAELELTLAGRTVRVDLPELRARLVAVLLQPPRGYAPGEFLPDEVALAAVWPGDAGKGRTDLNLLAYRARRDLSRAGIDPTGLLVRAKRGGGIALRVPVGVPVHVA